MNLKCPACGCDDAGMVEDVTPRSAKTLRILYCNNCGKETYQKVEEKKP